jgi:hypothetical protein
MNRASSRSSVLLALPVSHAALRLAEAGQARSQQARGPNVVLIYAHDLGYGDVSAYGARRVKTRNIDRLATDPAERANVATTRPEKVRELAALLERIRRASESLAGAARVK